MKKKKRVSFYFQKEIYMLLLFLVSEKALSKQILSLENFKGEIICLCFAKLAHRGAYQSYLNNDREPWPSG